MTDYTIITAGNTPNILKKINEAALNVWPEFMLHDPLIE